jgi:hypothetical protein
MFKQWLMSTLSGYHFKKRTIIILLSVMCILFCGFSWGISFFSRVLFPLEDAIDLELVTAFGSIVDIKEFQGYLDDPKVADEIASAVQANLSGNVYQIELPDLSDEPLGIKIVRIIADKLFS